jgi:1-acyl-sn-glycerol-3-phosphate acyltransferase
VTDVTVRASVPPIAPSASALERMNRVITWGGWAGRLALRRWIEHVDVRGREHLARGPLLVMMNHTSAFDPLILTFHARRAIQFVVTEPFMRVPIASRVAAWWGQVPKRKLEVDTRAIRTLQGWCRLGGIAGLFPEGQFPWDGRPLPLQPGLAQLVRYLDVPVVTARLFNGHRLWPPWAKHPRRTTLELEIDPPRKFASGDAIEETIAERLRVDPEASPCFPARCARPAEGLARFLRYCPTCASDEALSDEREHVRCGRCGGAWRVTADNRIVPGSSVAALAAGARIAWKTHWERDHVFVSRGDVEVRDVSGDASSLVAAGALVLDDSRLRVGSWSLGLSEILAHTLDWGEKILLRTERRRFALVMRNDSRAIWTFALDETLRAAGVARAEDAA